MPRRGVPAPSPARRCACKKTPTRSAMSPAASLRDRLVALVVELGELDDPSLVRDDSRLFEDLGINSMLGLELIMMCEEELGLVVPEQALYDIRTFGDVLRYAEK